MEERYNPMKSAEIATEHNYNMLDGILNNQAPPPEEKELDKVKEPPHKRRSRNGGTMTKKRRRPIHLHVMCPRRSRPYSTAHGRGGHPQYGGLYAENGPQWLCAPC